MIDKSKLAELREYNQRMHSETDWLNFFHTNFTQMLDTIEVLWESSDQRGKIIEQDGENMIEQSVKRNERMVKLEAVALAAKRWAKASQGRDSINAEAELAKALKEV